jgi:uncharacterized membrane protein
LLVVQPLATASCLFAVAWIAFDRFRDKKTALLFVLMFFFYLPARAALREDFHPEVVAEIFIFLAFIALERKKMRWFWVCVIPVMAAKENFLGVTFFLGGYAFGFKGRRKTGAVLMALSAALFLFEIRWVAPFFSKAPYFYGTNYALSSAEHGRSVLADPKRWEYLLKVYATFLFVPLFHLPTALLTVPICAQNFFAANPVLRSPNYHYSAGLTPFLFISTIYGLKVLCGTWRPLARYHNVVAGVLLIVILTQSGPPEYFYFWQCGHRRNAHTELVRRRLAGIDPARSVLTHNNFIPQLINRRWVYQLEYNPTPTKGELARRLGVDYVIVDEAFWEPKSAAPPEALADLRAAGYDTEFEKEGFFVLKRKG